MKSKFSKPIDLSEFETKVVVRPMTSDDFESVIALQRVCFPGMPTWTLEHLASQVLHFPEGQIVIEYDGELVASSGSLIVDFSMYSDWQNWREIADSGFIRNHDPDGDTLYGIEVMVHPEMRGNRLARRIYTERRAIASRYNLARSIVGGRIPGYKDHAESMTAREYVQKVIDKILFDPVLTTQISNGFVLKRLIPNYLPSDSDSRGWATFLEWTNLDYVPDPAKRFQRVSIVRICAVQYQMRKIESFNDFARQCEFFIDTASEYKSDFVLFPELLTTQLLSFTPSRSPSDAARKLAAFTPQYLEFFTDMSVKHNVNIIGGSQFAIEDEQLRNVSYLFRRDGTIERQYKIHITPAERHWWGVKPGNDVRVFTTDRGKIAILICYDIEFPELARIAASRGAQILFCPFNTDNREGYLRIRYCAQARCVENHVYTVLSGCAGNLPFVDNADVHYAQSGVFTPSDVAFSRDGVAAECTPNIEHLVIHDVDVELLRRHRLAGTVQNWNDRRTDIYHVGWTENGEEFTV